MNKGKAFLKDNAQKEKFKNFENALSVYNPDMLEISPKTPNQIYQYYLCVDEMYVWLKNAYKDNLCVLCNEMRAILGHLSEYNVLSEPKKNNLGKAYGHLRRLSVDTLKTLCDAFDKVFILWINKHARYDYRNIDGEYFPKYVELYNCAHKEYLKVQKLENLGSDRDNNIIKKYYEVAQLYYQVYVHHMNDRRKRIERITRKFKINNLLWVSSTLVISILSIWSAFL